MVETVGSVVGTSATDKDLADAARRLEEAVKLYDSKYGEITEIIGQIADCTEHSRAYRTEAVTDLKDDLQNWVEKVKKAQEIAQNIEAVLERENDVKELETEQRDLVQEILAGKQHVEKLKLEKERVHDRVNLVQVESERVASKKKDYIPSLKYLLKAMKKISNVVLVEGENPNVIRGFVPKPNSEEVSPFNYDEYMSPYDRVNKLWDEIYTSS